MIVSKHDLIVVLLGLCLAVVFLQGFAFPFQDTHGFGQGLVGICFVAIAAALPYPDVSPPSRPTCTGAKINGGNKSPAKVKSSRQTMPAFPVALTETVKYGSCPSEVLL